MGLYQRIFPAVLFSIIVTSTGMASEEQGKHRGEGTTAVSGKASSKIYLKECGSCHLAYQPQLLPKRSWEKIMNSLDNHFGDSATLDDASKGEILAYVVNNSAETSSSEVSRKVLASLSKDEAPLRISDTKYFKRKHREVRAGVFKRKSIGSPSNCGACHLTAENGDYDEHKVKIPKN